MSSAFHETDRDRSRYVGVRSSGQKGSGKRRWRDARIPAVSSIGPPPGKHVKERYD